MYIPVMQVRNSEVLIYREWIGPRKAPNQERLFGGKQAYSGKMTSGSQKRLKKAISLLVQKSTARWIHNPVSGTRHQFRVAFVTLTIADQGKDEAPEVYKNCLAKWLRWAKRTGMVDYVWKAELQKRGTLHYHLATNQFIHWKDARDVWNKYQKQSGYLDSYARQNGHFKPNSTDIHSIRKIKDIERYLTKYMQKGVGEASIKGKTWDASTNLKKSNYYATELTPFNLDMLRAHGTKEIRTDHCTIFRIKQDTAPALLDRVQQVEYQSFIKSI